MCSSDLQALKIDIVALEAMLRAVIRAQAGQSQSHLHGLLDSLQIEADRLGRFSHLDDLGHRAANGVLEAWIEEFRSELSEPNPDPVAPGGRKPCSVPAL
jgi:hypothetical protein